MTPSPGLSEAVATAAGSERPARRMATRIGVRSSGLRLGFVNPEAWGFLKHLHAWLSTRHETAVFAPRGTRAPVFRERILRRRLHADMQAFLERHDVVFFEWASEMLALATHLPKRCAVVARLHRYELYAWADRINWAAVDRIILVSAAKQREFAGRFPDQAHKTVVVPAGVPLQQFPFAERTFSGSLGTLCHISPRKRVYELLLALADPMREDPSLHLHVAGAPMPEYRDYYEALLRLVGRLGFDERVIFHGAVDSPWEWYPNIDVFISHSYSEGMQVAPVEAMASGCFTLSHDWEGSDELLPADCRYVTDRELTARIATYRDLPEAARQQQRLRMRALAAERFDADRVHERIDEIIQQCAGQDH